MTQPMPFLPGLSPVRGRPLTALQDAGNLTSNGGLIVLREAALRLEIAEVIAGPLPDKRNPALILHTYGEMVTARIMAIAAGGVYPRPCGGGRRRSRRVAQRSSAHDRLWPRPRNGP